MMSATEGLPPGAPYGDVVIGQEIEVRVWLDGGTLRCEFEFQDAPFGGGVEIENIDGIERVLAIDSLISGVCTLLWDDFLGTPVFREQDEEWWTRVEASRSWEGPRRPTRGWLAPDVLEALGAAPAAELEVRDDKPEVRNGKPRELEPGQQPTRDDPAAKEDLLLTQDEMAALMRGEIPDTLDLKLLEARSTENLLSAAIATVEERAQEDGVMNLSLSRVAAELREVLRRVV